MMNDWLYLIDGNYIYIALAFMLVGGAFGLPIPEDLPLVFGGVLLHHKRAQLGLLFFSCYIAILIGDLIIFGIGYKFGFSLFQTKYLKHKVPPERIKKINARLEKHAITMIFLARHLFYLRTATLLACGAFRMSILRFAIIDAFAALFSTSFMIGIGFLAAEHLPQLFVFLEGLRNASLIVALGLAIAIGVIIYRKRCKLQVNPVETIPPE